MVDLSVKWQMVYMKIVRCYLNSNHLLLSLLYQKQTKNLIRLEVAYGESISNQTAGNPIWIFPAENIIFWISKKQRFF